MQTTEDRKIKLIRQARGEYTVHLVRGDGSGTSEAVGEVRQRAEIYSGIRGGGTYRYWDATAADGRRVVTTTYRCTSCGGEVHIDAGRIDGGFHAPLCMSCGKLYRHPEHPKRIDGVALTTARGRFDKLSADTRRDAIDALLRATGHGGVAS